MHQQTHCPPCHYSLGSTYCFALRVLAPFIGDLISATPHHNPQLENVCLGSSDVNWTIPYPGQICGCKQEHSVGGCGKVKKLSLFVMECKWLVDSSLSLFFSTPGPVLQSWAINCKWGVLNGNILGTFVHYGPEICFHFSADFWTRQISITPIFPWHMANLEHSLLFIGNPNKKCDLFSLKPPCVLRIFPGIQAFTE